MDAGLDSRRGAGRPAARRHARGVGLIEVMVAILVLGVGMLGVAAMQAMTLRNSQGALERSQAVIQTYSILDSMRANRVQAIGGAYNLASMTCAAPAAADLVTRDQNTWLTSLKNQLGDSTCGQINCTAAGNCTITVRWDAERGGGSSQQLQTQSGL